MNSYDFEVSPLGEILINYFKEGIIAIGVDKISSEDSIEYQFIKYLFLITANDNYTTIYWFFTDNILLYTDRNSIAIYSFEAIYNKSLRNFEFKSTKDIIYVDPNLTTNQKEVVEVVNLTDFINKYVTVKYYEEV